MFIWLSLCLLGGRSLFAVSPGLSSSPSPRPLPVASASTNFSELLARGPPRISRSKLLALCLRVSCALQASGGEGPRLQSWPRRLAATQLWRGRARSGRPGAGGACCPETSVLPPQTGSLGHRGGAAWEPAPGVGAGRGGARAGPAWGRGAARREGPLSGGRGLEGMRLGLGGMRLAYPGSFEKTRGDWGLRLGTRKD